MSTAKCLLCSSALSRQVIASSPRPCIYDCVSISRDVDKSGEEYENKRDVIGWLESRTAYVSRRRCKESQLQFDYVVVCQRF